MKRLFLIAPVLLLAGCMRFTTVKSATVQPSMTATVVTATSVVTCHDYFAFQRCWNELSMEATPINSLPLFPKGQTLNLKQ